jgi:serine protease
MTHRCATGAALLVLALGIKSGGQTPGASPRTILSPFGPTPIERGISPDMSHAPGTPEARRRASLRSASSLSDRIGSSGLRFRSGRVVVKFKAGATAASRLTALSVVSPSATLSPRAAYQDFDIVQINASEDPEAAARRFAARPDVEYAQASYRVYPDLVPNDRFYSEQWNLPLLDLERAWDIQPAAGSSIVVAVLDTGVAYTAGTAQFHASAFTVDASGNVGPPGSGGTAYPSLGSLTLSFVAATELGPSTRFVAPHDFIWNDNQPFDLHGHGTHVSGTLGQLTNNGSNNLGDIINGGGTAGVAFNVKLMPVKVLSTEWDDIFGSPNAGTDDVVALGIRYAADNGAKVINMSLGRSGPASCGSNPNQSGCAPVIEAALKYAVGKGCFVAISAGNAFTEGNPTEVIAEIATRVAGVVSVAAVDPAKGHASYSSSGTWVELAAPGGEFGAFGSAGGVLQQTLDIDLVDTFDRPPAQFVAPRFDSLAYFFFVGTSQAAPHVSGLAAMLMQQGITDPAAIEAALEHFATDLGATGRDALFGFGLIQARNTLRGLGLAR